MTENFKYYEVGDTVDDCVVVDVGEYFGCDDCLYAADIYDKKCMTMLCWKKERKDQTNVIFKHIDLIIQEVYEKLRGWLQEEKYDLVDQYLQSIDTEKENIDILGAILTYTFPYKDKLPNRACFMDKTKIRFNRSMPETETNEILSFLE